LSDKDTHFFESVALRLSPHRCARQRFQSLNALCVHVGTCINATTHQLLSRVHTGDCCRRKRCRRIWRQSSNSATVTENGDCRRIRVDRALL